MPGNISLHVGGVFLRTRRSRTDLPDLLSSQQPDCAAVSGTACRTVLRLASRGAPYFAVRRTDPSPATPHTRGECKLRGRSTGIIRGKFKSILCGEDARQQNMTCRGRFAAPDTPHTSEECQLCNRSAEVIRGCIRSRRGVLRTQYVAGLLRSTPPGIVATAPRPFSRIA